MRLSKTSDSAARPASVRTSSGTGSVASRAAPSASEDAVELTEVGLDALPGDMDVAEAQGQLGDDADVDVLLPLGALLLHPEERLMHVGDVDARGARTRATGDAGAAGACR